MRTKVLLVPALLAAAGLALVACRDAPDVTDPEAREPAFSNAKSGQGGTAAAVVHFGDHGTGSPFPPAVHDRSYHAKDKIVPRTVTIERGGSVRFELGPEHQVAIFEPGTTPGDIDATEVAATKPEALRGTPLNQIVYDDGRVARSPDPAEKHQTWPTPSGTFDAPGRYLMVCTTDLHFLDADMYGWIEVK